jgi:uncharacterized protein (DUF58 family)
VVTRSGYVVAIAAVAFLAAGWLSGFDELLALGAAALLLVVFSLAWVGFRPSLAVERTIEPDRVTVGETALGLVTVKNTSRRASRAMVAEERFGSESLEIPIGRLAPGEESSTPYQLPTGRRGVITVGPMVLRRADPFGLVSTSRDYGIVRTLWVHPRVHPVRPLPSGVSRDLEGPTSDTAPQGGMAFHTLREYVRGDDLRHIHWRSTARFGRLMVRHMVDSSHPVNTVLLDTRASSYAGDHFEDAVEAAASIVVACTRNNFPIRLVTSAGIDVGGRRTLTSTAMLDLLAGVTTDDEHELLESIQAISTSSTGGSLVVITGEPGADDLPALTRLRRRFDRMVVLRFHEGVQLGTSAMSRGGVPGAVSIDATSPEAFRQFWSRLSRS